MDFGPIVPLIVSAILGTASIYSMMQNSLMVAVVFMLLLYIFAILFSKFSDRSTNIKEAEYILIQDAE
jgi:hypothetical protein